MSDLLMRGGPDKKLHCVARLDLPEHLPVEATPKTSDFTNTTE